MHFLFEVAGRPTLSFVEASLLRLFTSIKFVDISIFEDQVVCRAGSHSHWHSFGLLGRRLDLTKSECDRYLFLDE